jgi:hypothetical protein
MLLMNKASIRETFLFPLMKPVENPPPAAPAEGEDNA